MPRDRLARALHMQKQRHEKNRRVHFAQQAKDSKEAAVKYTNNLRASLLKPKETSISINNSSTSLNTNIHTNIKVENPPAPPQQSPTLNNNRRKRKRDEERNLALKQYRKTYLGINSELSADQRIGKFVASETFPPLGQVQQDKEPPTPTELRTTGFGQTSINHSFNQEASFETTLLCIVKSGFLDEESKKELGETHPLIEHLIKMIKELAAVDFSSLRTYNTEWATQKETPKERVRLLLACLLHYDGRVGDVMRYLGGNYTAEYRDINNRIE